MLSVSAPFPGLSLSFGLRKRIRPAQKPVPAEDRQATRDFIAETLSRCPDAFASEADLQAMLYLYPGRF